MITPVIAQALRFAEESGANEINPDDVTPGVIGFAITAIFAVVVILIGVDMYRRIRRMQYRQEVRDDIQAELSGEQRDDEEHPEASEDSPGFWPR